MKLEKSIFYIYIIEYLGYVITESGVKINPIKISVIKEWPVPRNIFKV